MIKDHRHTHTHTDGCVSCFSCPPHFTTACLSHTRASRPQAEKTPLGYQIHGLSFLTRSSLAHNSILTGLLCVFLPLLLCFLTPFLSVLSFISFLLHHYNIWKHVESHFLSVCHSLHPLAVTGGNSKTFANTVY